MESRLRYSVFFSNFHKKTAIFLQKKKKKKKIYIYILYKKRNNGTSIVISLNKISCKTLYLSSNTMEYHESVGLYLHKCLSNECKCHCWTSDISVVSEDQSIYCVLIMCE